MINENPFPAILVGGPPHSGKSVLIYSLTRALRQAHVGHYVVRACPDGEGDWSNEVDQALLPELRVKGKFTPEFVETAVRHVDNRHLPLLVDVGGKPRPWQEVVFAQCTHAILLEPASATEAGVFSAEMARWQAMMADHGVTVIAKLQSSLSGDDVTWGERDGVLTGQITGLERGEVVDGPTFQALVQTVKGVFTFSEAALTAVHLPLAPTEITLDLPSLADTLGATNRYWLPEHLPQLADYLPAQTPLAMYGRASLWLYGFIGWHALPAPVWQFDPRLGWVEPPQLQLVKAEGKTTRVDNWCTVLTQQDGMQILHLSAESQYLDIQEPETFPIVRPEGGQGVVISGRLPIWLVLALVRQLGKEQTWIAIYQPPLNGAVVVASQTPETVSVGKVIPVMIKSPFEKE